MVFLTRFPAKDSQARIVAYLRGNIAYIFINRIS
jgi:hypothetical protein